MPIRFRRKHDRGLHEKGDKILSRRWRGTESAIGIRAWRRIQAALQRCSK